MSVVVGVAARNSHILEINSSRAHLYEVMNYPIDCLGVVHL